MTKGVAGDYRFVEANPAFEQQTGLANVVGRTIRELAPGIEATLVRDLWACRPHRRCPVASMRRRGTTQTLYDAYTFRVGPLKSGGWPSSSTTSARHARPRGARAVARRDSRWNEPARLRCSSRRPSFIAVFLAPARLRVRATKRTISSWGIARSRRPAFDERSRSSADQGLEALLEQVRIETVSRSWDVRLPVDVAANARRPARDAIPGLGVPALVDGDGTRSAWSRMAPMSPSRCSRGTRWSGCSWRANVRAPRRRRRARTGRDGEPREGRVPRRDEPRAAHAAQRHRRLRGADGDGDSRPDHRRAARATSRASRQSQRHLLGLINQVLNYTRSRRARCATTWPTCR